MDARDYVAILDRLYAMTLKASTEGLFLTGDDPELSLSIKELETPPESEAAPEPPSKARPALARPCVD